MHENVVLYHFQHSSHKMQPLDKTFFGHLKSAYNKACDPWIFSHPGRRITMFDVAGLVGEAYGRCATVEKGVSEFSSTGIFPFNPDIFHEHDYAPALVTDNPAPLQPTISNTGAQPGMHVIIQPQTLMASVLQKRVRQKYKNRADEQEDMSLVNQPKTSTVSVQKRIRQKNKKRANEQEEMYVVDQPVTSTPMLYRKRATEKQKRAGGKTRYLWSTSRILPRLQL